MSIEENLYEVIEYIVDGKYKQYSADKTEVIKGTIVTCKDISTGKYKVKIDTSYVEAYSARPEVIYRDNDVVFLLNTSNIDRKVIIGLVDGTYVEPEPEEDIIYYDNIGENVAISDKEFSLCSYHTEEKTIYAKNATETPLNINIADLKTNIKDASALYCSANFMTNIAKTREVLGNYGISYYINYDYKNDGNITTEKYTLDINKFLGKPYELNEYTNQEYVFAIDATHFVDIEKITIFVKDFNQDANITTDDIFIKDLQIIAYKEVSYEESKRTRLLVDFPNGTLYNYPDNINLLSRITIKASGNKEIQDYNKAEIHWFYENVLVDDKQDPRYSELAGPGWVELNYTLYNNSFNLCNIDLSPFAENLKEVLLKCCVLYNNVLLEVSNLQISALEATYKVEIVSTNGTSFSSGIGYTNLKCNLIGSFPQSTAFKTQWYELDDVGNRTRIFQGTISSVYDQGNIIGYAEAKRNLDSADAALAAAKAQSATSRTKSLVEYKKDLDNAKKDYYAFVKNEELYNSLLDSSFTGYVRYYGTKFKPEDKNDDNAYLYNIAASSINKYKTYKCAVSLLDGTYCGTATITLRNEIIENEKYSILIENGKQSFKYNKDGLAPNLLGNEENQEIKPLTFKIYDSKGNLVLDSNYRGFSSSDIEWLPPEDNTMIIPLDDKNVDYSRYYFDISRIYKNNYTNNDIILKVKYDNQVITGSTSFTFVKEGDVGTNGTDYICKIVGSQEDYYGCKPILATTYGSSNGIYLVDKDGTEHGKQVTTYLQYIYFDKNSNKYVNTWIPYSPTDEWLIARLYKDGEIVFDSSDASTFSNISKIEWSVLNNKNGYSNLLNADKTKCYFIFNPNINELDRNNISLVDSEEREPFNIVKCEITIKGKIYSCTYPVITSYLTSIDAGNIGTDEEYNSYASTSVKLIPDTGFFDVLYNSNGRNPQYRRGIPYNITCAEPIKELQTIEEDVTDSDNISYNWSVCGGHKSVDEEGNPQYIKVNNISIKSDRNILNATPTNDFINTEINNAIRCDIFDNNKRLGSIHIPINMYLDRYSNTLINGWDGNSVSINDDGGVILAPQVGAGKKEDDNSFTGMVMGVVKESGSLSEEIGLFGYNKGDKTVFISAEDGHASFGRKGRGQMIIDPRGEGHAMLYSPDFWERYEKNGLPITSYTWNGKQYDGQNINPDENHISMAIDLTDARIIFNNGQFMVDKNGLVLKDNLNNDVFESIDTIQNTRIEFYTYTNESVELDDGTIKSGEIIINPNTPKADSLIITKMLSPTNKVDEKKYFLTANVPMIITPEQEIVNKDIEINGEEKTITYLKDKQVILHFEYNYKHFNIKEDIVIKDGGNRIVSLNKIIPESIDQTGYNNFNVYLSIENGSLKIEECAIDAAIFGTSLYKDADKEVY